MRLTKKVSVDYNPAPQKYGSRAIYKAVNFGHALDIQDELGSKTFEVHRILPKSLEKFELHWEENKNHK